LYAWGQNRFGQLGDGTRADRSIPVPVNLPEDAPMLSRDLEHL
jgi:alpha-tubulin suppressor-like RCC1 family protein